MEPILDSCLDDIGDVSRVDSADDLVDGTSEPTGRILVARIERSSSVAI